MIRGHRRTSLYGGALRATCSTGNLFMPGGYARKKDKHTHKIRRMKIGQGQPTISEFVAQSRRHKDEEKCLCVPGAVAGCPAKVQFCGKTITAARYMALLVHGTPSTEGQVVRHTCGNGHLSCVNPHHVIWGTPGENIGDANIHRAIPGGTNKEKRRAVEARTSK